MSREVSATRGQKTALKSKDEGGNSTKKKGGEVNDGLEYQVGTLTRPAESEH